jgi:integrase
MRLEKSEIDALACPPGKREIMAFDDDLRGFAIRVASSGEKVFVFQYRRGKSVKRKKLGRYGNVTPAEARRLAKVAAGIVAGGGDPVELHQAALAAERAERAAKKQARKVSSFTLEKLVKGWEETALATASASHKREAPAALRRMFPDMVERPAESLRTAELQAAIDKKAKASPSMARRVRDYGRAAFNWAVSRELVPSNPFTAVRIESRPVSRDRALTDPELGAVWRAAGGLAYPFGPLLRLLILTLQRRNEVAGMTWAELDPDLSTWTLPAERAKNRKKHIVHLAEPARAELRALAKLPRKPGQTLIFTTTGDTPVSGFSRAANAVRAAMLAETSAKAKAKGEGKAPSDPVPDWRLHDFRRTGVTTLARLGVPPHVADKLLNHLQGTIRGVAAVYQRHDFMAEREAATRLWADHVLAVAAADAGTPAALPGNVVRLATRPRK